MEVLWKGNKGWTHTHIQTHKRQILKSTDVKNRDSELHMQYVSTTQKNHKHDIYRTA